MTEPQDAAAHDRDTWYPVQDATDPVHGIHIGGTVLTNVHDPARCVGRGCSIHHPSDHHMAAWPAVWRGDKGFFERTCPHGLGHPDPDDVAYLTSIGNTWAGSHGCDGCCSGD